VIDSARGVCCRDEGGDGEAAGDEYSIDGLVTRLGPETVVALNADLAVSSSDAPISTSFKSDDRNEGWPLASVKGRDNGDPVRLLAFG
jgi:hypothetical protein